MKLTLLLTLVAGSLCAQNTNFSPAARHKAKLDAATKAAARSQTPLELRNARIAQAITSNASNAPVRPPPVFSEPATTDSQFLVQCPKCNALQILSPKKIVVTGSHSTTNGVMQSRVLHFKCGTRKCREEITINDQAFIPNVKAVRVN